MKKPETVLLYGHIAFSVLTSFLCVFYAVSVIMNDIATEWQKAFAYVVGGYGLMNVYILSAAWNGRPPWAPKADLLIAGCFFAILVFDTINDGFSRGLAGIAVPAFVALALWINWNAVKKVCER